MSSFVSETLNYFQRMYEQKGSVWGHESSDLAHQAVAMFRSVLAEGAFAGEDIRVLELGCGDGRDSLFFASQGWRVDAVDRSSRAVEALNAKAQAFGVADRVRAMCGDLEDVRGGPYHLIFSNYTLHFVGGKRRRDLIARLQAMTCPGGLQAHLAIMDFNEEYLGDLRDYRYLDHGELTRSFHGWRTLDAYQGMVPDEHPGVPAHEHCVSSLIAQKPARPGGMPRRVPSNKAPAALAGASLAIAVLLCTLGYDSLDVKAIATVWPGAMLQSSVAILTGGWGVLATVLGAMITNAINVKTLFAVLAFVPANAVQAALPAWHYRHLLRKGGWNVTAFRFWRFAVWAVLVPNVAGAVLAAGVMALAGDGAFTTIFVKWLVANVPIGLVFGWPLFRICGPSMVRQGWAAKGWWS